MSRGNPHCSVKFPGARFGRNYWNYTKRPGRERESLDKENCLEINLLEKTELWIEGVTLQNVQLDDISIQVAEALELAPGENDGGGRAGGPHRP